MSVQSRGRLARGDIPQADRLVAASRGQQLPIGSKRHALHGSGMPLETALLFRFCEIPNQEQVVVTARGQQLSVRGKGHTKDGLGMRLHDRGSTSTRDIPN